MAGRRWILSSYIQFRDGLKTELLNESNVEERVSETIRDILPEVRETDDDIEDNVALARKLDWTCGWVTDNGFVDCTEIDESGKPLIRE